MVLRRVRHQGDGCGGGASGGRAGGEAQLALRAVDVQRLSAVFTAARLLSSPHHEFRSSVSGRSVSRARRGCGLGGDAWGEFNCVWDDGVAAFQRVPEGEAGGFGGRRSAAGQGGGGASRGEVWQRDAPHEGFRSLGQVGWFGWTNGPVPPQMGATSSCFVTEQTSPPQSPSLVQTFRLRAVGGGALLLVQEALGAQ